MQLLQYLRFMQPAAGRGGARFREPDETLTPADTDDSQSIRLGYIPAAEYPLLILTPYLTSSIIDISISGRWDSTDTVDMLTESGPSELSFVDG
jgi:hypothetical protein